jgi:drug/metabolite transporter (DMT)-like permease
MLGIALSALAAASWGIGSIFVRLGMVNIRPTTGTLITLIASLVFLAPILLVAEKGNAGAAIASLPAAAVFWMALSGFFNFGMGRLLNYNAVRLAGVAKASPILAISPLFSVLLAVLFLGEQVTPLLLLGAVAIVAGTVLVVMK